MTYSLKSCDVCGAKFAPSSGRQKRCSKECQRIGYNATSAAAQKRRGSEFVEAKRQYRRDWYKANKKRVIEKNRQYRNKNKSQQRAYFSQYRQHNASRLRAMHAAWRLQKGESYKSGRRLYRQRVLHVLRERARKRQLEREATDPVYRLVRRIRSRIKMAFKTASTRKEGGTFEYLGMCGRDFLEYLLNHQNNQNGLFTAENYGSVWVIDHIRPIASFNISDASEARRAFHYSNCQPLLIKENESKGSFWNGFWWKNGVAYSEPIQAVAAQVA